VSDVAPAFPFAEFNDLTLDPAYARLRREKPVIWVEFPHGGAGWLVTTHEEAKFVHSDRRFSRALTAERDVPRMMRNIPPASSIAEMDGPDHVRLRRLIAEAFTVRRIETLRPRVQQIADGLVDRLDSPGDLVAGFTSPLPVTVMCELLGVPFGDRTYFRRWIERFTSASGVFTPEQTAEGAVRLREYIAGLIAQRRAVPTGDLLGALVAARDEDNALSEPELVSIGMALLVAGHETTVNQMGDIIAILLEHPEAMAQMRQEPGLVPGAVEELLRYVPLNPTAGLTRIASEDVQVGDVRVRKGEAVLVVTASANRDESAFERAEDLDLHRRDSGKHLAFGYGRHYCPGAMLARMQLQVGIGTLLRRLPGLRLAEPIEFTQGGVQKGPRRLVTAW
jgi:cytochrome P450